jgi:hypothetical protein
VVRKQRLQDRSKRRLIHRRRHRRGLLLLLLLHRSVQRLQDLRRYGRWLLRRRWQGGVHVKLLRRGVGIASERVAPVRHSKGGEHAQHLLRHVRGRGVVVAAPAGGERVSTCPVLAGSPRCHGARCHGGGLHVRHVSPQQRRSSQPQRRVSVTAGVLEAAGDRCQRRRPSRSGDWIRSEGVGHAAATAVHPLGRWRRLAVPRRYKVLSASRGLRPWSCGALPSLRSQL